MIKYGIITILRSFSEKELRRFEEFIRSPFHNKNTKVIRLFEELKKHHPDYTSDTLTKHSLFKKLAGSEKYKESYLRNLFSDLNLQAENFMRLDLLLNHTGSEKLFIEHLVDKDLYELAAKKIKAFGKKISSDKAKDQSYYMNKNFIYEIQSFLTVDKTLTDNFRKQQILNIIKLFMISLMETSFYLIIEEQRVNIRHEYGFLRSAIQYITDNLSDFEDSPLLMVDYYLWMCFFYGNDDKYFMKARELFRKHFSSFSKTDKKNTYSVMQIFYINKIDSGSSSYNSEFLNFMLEMLKFNVLSHRKNDFINLNLYRNILILCTMQKETETLKKFISRYSGYVDSGSRNTVLAYSNAHLCFLQGDHESALELCSRINFNDLLKTSNENIFFKNDIRALILKCLYELHAFESAISHIDAFKHFLNHSRLLKNIPKKKLWNFLNTVNDLIKLNISFNELKFMELRNKISSSKELIHTAWLNEKILELELRSRTNKRAMKVKR